MHTRTRNATCPERTPQRSLIGLAAIGFTALALSGCGSLRGNHVEVGAVPDDYRTRHPIIISEKEHAFDIPVASGDRSLTMSMRESVRGIVDNYHRSSTGAIRLMVPSGSVNAGAASVIANDIATVLKQEGIPGNRIISTPYQASASGDAAPIRVTFLAVSASTQPCGRWPEDMLQRNDENLNYENFGCASQNNLAAQIANPADLLGPRGASQIDAERRTTAIQTYRENGAGQF